MNAIRWNALRGLVVVALLAIPHAAEAQYTFTKIMYPGSTWTEASGVNDSGQVVGTYTDTAGIAHGFLYANGTYTQIDYPGTAHNYAFGINNAGKIVGSFSPVMPRGPYHGSLYDSGAWSEYDFPGNETDGRAINTAGDIVGIYNAGYGTPDHGFLKVGETYTSIDYPNSQLTYVFGLNDSGYISGTFRDAFGLLKGFVYAAGTYTAVTYPNATETYIGGINNANAVTGWKVEGGKVGGFVMTTGRFRPVLAPFAGAANTKPRAINNNGVVVGTYTAPDCGFGCGFIATPAPALPPLCSQTIGMTHNGTTLTTNFTIRTSVTTNWTTWLLIGSNAYRLWSLPVGVVNPAQSVSVPIQLPPVGNVLLASYLSTSTHGTVCVDYTTLNTGGQ